MPPRPLCGTEDEAIQLIESCAKSIPPLKLEAAGIAVFPETNVVYVEISSGRDALLEIHSRLNIGALTLQEAYSYHPHITLAQDLTQSESETARDIALREWKNYQGPRSYEVSEITFVRNVAGLQWVDLATIHLSERVNV
ncbi:MAG: 2'-5' RNA ligase family protein [Candidatus Solibacter usitatus]|nr:2'-5' RNA ligase family protein [Candidatus Solibacter usitatus]